MSTLPMMRLETNPDSSLTSQSQLTNNHTPTDPHNAIHTPTTHPYHNLPVPPTIANASSMEYVAETKPAPSLSGEESEDGANEGKEKEKDDGSDDTLDAKSLSQSKTPSPQLASSISPSPFASNKTNDLLMESVDTIRDTFNHVLLFITFQSILEPNSKAKICWDWFVIGLATYSYYFTAWYSQ